jgi:release factor glutamine methyltransferase
MRAAQNPKRMNVSSALTSAAARLAAVSDTPRLDAELLMAHALGTTREALLLSHLRDPAPAAFEPLVARRLAHEPIAYILGTRGFWTIDLEVGPGVLIPRPDTETLLDAALAHFGKAGPKTILDLGTGSGALLLAALDQWPQATGHGRDASPEALVIAARNAARLGLAGRAAFSLGDWAEGLSGPFDLILCNPPYVEADADLPPDVREWEPPSALLAGPDGLDDYRRLAPEIARLLAPDGIACVEIGATQAAAAGALFEAHGLRVSVRKDLAGRDRCLVLRH